MNVQLGSALSTGGDLFDIAAKLGEPGYDREQQAKRADVTENLLTCRPSCCIYNGFTQDLHKGVALEREVQKLVASGR